MRVLSAAVAATDLSGVNITRIQLSTLDDARRVVLDLLDCVPERSRGRLAGQVVAALRDAGLLAASIEEHYSAAQVARFLGRSAEWVSDRARAGDFGRVVRDDGGWLIPASGVQRYLDAHSFYAEVKAA